MIAGLATETMVVSIRIMKKPITSDQRAAHGLATFSMRFLRVRVAWLKLGVKLRVTRWWPVQPRSARISVRANICAAARADGFPASGSAPASTSSRTTSG